MNKLTRKEPFGRPTKYNDLTVSKSWDYIESCGRESTELPTIEGLANYLDITKETVYEWAKKYDDFSYALKKIHDKQKTQLINDGMYGGKEVNAAMAIFLLKANHGMIETSRVEHTGENGEPIKIIIGTGFVPAGTVIDATPEDGVIGGQPPVQDNSLASQSPENNNGHL